MNKDNIRFTQDWWLRTINDTSKLTRWLQKLQRTEFGGYQDHIDYMAANSVTEREQLILTNIAEDELKHSNLLIDLFAGRGIAVDANGENSTYWDEILSHVNSTAEYCAANYFGESLAATRFEIIQDMSQTPSDIREVIRQVLPDEIFHRETLKRMAGDEVIARMQTLHDAAYQRLTGVARWHLLKKTPGGLSAMLPELYPVTGVTLAYTSGPNGVLLKSPVAAYLLARIGTVCTVTPTKNKKLHNNES